MTTAQSTTTDRTATSITGFARGLLDGTALGTTTIAPDLDHSLLASASAVLAQLRVLNQLCRSAEYQPRMIVGIFDLAKSFQICSPGALGVSGVLVDRIREADEAEIGHLLASAHTNFSDQELTAGAAALLAATTSYLADAVGEDPMMVHDEIHRSDQIERNFATRRFCRRAL